MRDSKNYSEFELMPTEGNYDATSHLGEAFQSKSVVNSVQVDSQNYCEIELDLYDTTCHQKETSDKSKEEFGRSQLMEFDPYSELELSSTPASQAYDAINGQKPRAKFLPVSSHACNEYFEVKQLPADIYTASYKGDKPDAAMGDISEAYSEIAVRSTEEYNTTTHLKASSSTPFLPDDYSDIGMPLSCNDYDTTTHDQVMKKQRAKISTVTSSQEYYSDIDTLTSMDQTKRKKALHPAKLPKPASPQICYSTKKAALVSPVVKNFGKELEKALSRNGIGADTIC